VYGDILGRLGGLFATPQGARGLTTDFILRNFRDLGDQYASTFKEALQQIASLRDGKWYERNASISHRTGTTNVDTSHRRVALSR
jgi:hypothetical protein